jgi:diguanylate cyclase (GGDEF)-like protein
LVDEENRTKATEETVGGEVTYKVIGIVITFVVVFGILFLLADEHKTKFWIHHLFLLPVVIAALFFNVTGGAVSALIACMASYKVITSSYPSGPPSAMNILIDQGFLGEWVLYISVGSLIGVLEMTYFKSMTQKVAEKGRYTKAKGDMTRLQKELSACRGSAEEKDQKILAISSRMMLLQNVAKDLGGTLDIEALLVATLQATSKILKARRSSIFFFAPDMKHLISKATYGWDKEEPREKTLDKEKELIGWCVKTGDIFTIEDLKKNYDLQDLAKRSDFKSIMSAPLGTKNDIIGVLNIEKTDTNKVTQDDVRILSILADLSTLAIKNSRLFKKVEFLANTDGLTKLYTHRYFQDFLKKELDRSKRYKKCFSIIMSDIDHFKSFNDTYGHQAGDLVLEDTARIVVSCKRASDLVARYGGEEFIAILPETDIEGSKIVAERIRREIEKHVYPFENKQLKVTISLGTATFPQDSEDKDDLIKSADMALYHAKESGRNRVSVASVTNAKKR